MFQKLRKYIKILIFFIIKRWKSIWYSSGIKVPFLFLLPIPMVKWTGAGKTSLIKRFLFNDSESKSVYFYHFFSFLLCFSLDNQDVFTHTYTPTLGFKFKFPVCFLCKKTKKASIWIKKMWQCGIKKLIYAFGTLQDRRNFFPWRNVQKILKKRGNFNFLGDFLAYFQRADGVVIVFDITNEESFKSFDFFGFFWKFNVFFKKSKNSGWIK